ncbi:MAG: zf-TFIIB domain-containing protein [Fimbriimonadales bacterium]
MKCPRCEVIDLTMAERAGVEIDYCPACRGVWLDRAELDKIIDRTLAAGPRAVSPGSVASGGPDRPQGRDDRDRRRRDDDDEDGDRGGFFRRFFDFD